MYFNIKTGKESASGSDLCCWLADGNLWVSCSLEISASHFPINEFCNFLDESIYHLNDELNLNTNKYSIYLEPDDEGYRNIIIRNGDLHICFSIKNEYIFNFAKFLRSYVYKIDQEFDELVKQINLKLNEAAQALKEVNKLRSKADLKSLIDSSWIRVEISTDAYEEFELKIKNIDTSQLETELNKAGWSTSSSYC